MKINREEMNTVLFSNLVIMLSSTAMQQLGKLVNPMTSKTEVNLEGAQVTIDIIEMLKDKTKGNLTKEEERLMKDILASLQMNYVETSQLEEKSKTSQNTESKPTDTPNPTDQKSA